MESSWLRLLFSYLQCAPCLSAGSPQVGEADDTEDGKKKPSGWKCMPYIIGNETFEKLASIGLTANFTVYLVSHFRMEQVAAANLAQIFFGTTNFAPLAGAFLSDAYWGRFRTLAYASIASFLGLITLTLTSVIPKLKPTACSALAQQADHCLRPTSLELGVLYLALGLLILGAGGIRPCSLPFGVDQFDLTTDKGHKGLNSFFNWYYCTATAALLIGLTVIVYIQDAVSWPIGFGIPTGFMLFSIVFFFLGVRLYVYVPPERSVFSGIAVVFVAAFRKRSLKLPDEADVEVKESLYYDPPTKNERVTKLALSRQFRFLNKAAFKCDDDLKPDGSPANTWRLGSIQQVEEVKCLIRIAPIWASGIIGFAAVTQQWTFVVLQALKMDRHLGPNFQLPAGTIAAISLLALTLFMPFYDQVFVPMARKFTKQDTGITLLQRQGIGMVLATGSMIVAAMVEKKRRNSALLHGGISGTSPMSAALWLSPQLILMGVAESFIVVGQIEFYNRQFPDHMQTLAGSLSFCSLSGASYLSSLLVAIIKKSTKDSQGRSWLESDINSSRLDLFYYALALLGVLNLVYFLVCAHFYRYKGASVKDVKDQHREKEDVQ